jgi:hypothetical protein
VLGANDSLQADAARSNCLTGVVFVPNVRVGPSFDACVRWDATDGHQRRRLDVQLEVPAHVHRARRERQWRAEEIVTRWTVESESLQLLSRLGWTKSSIKPGDRIRVTGARARNGDPAMRCRTIDLPDGTSLSCFPTEEGPNSVFSLNQLPYEERRLTQRSQRPEGSSHRYATFRETLDVVGLHCRPTGTARRIANERFGGSAIVRSRSNVPAPPRCGAASSVSARSASSALIVRSVIESSYIGR